MLPKRLKIGCFEGVKATKEAENAKIVAGRPEIRRFRRRKSNKRSRKRRKCCRRALKRKKAAEKKVEEDKMYEAAKERKW